MAADTAIGSSSYSTIDTPTTMAVWVNGPVRTSRSWGSSLSGSSANTELGQDGKGFADRFDGQAKLASDMQGGAHGICPHGFMASDSSAYHDPRASRFHPRAIAQNITPLPQQPCGLDAGRLPSRTEPNRP
jgi:hypothetical protein